MLRGTVKMVKIHTNVNSADALTKVVHVAKFRTCLNLAGLYMINKIHEVLEKE